jgi:transcriptional regulator
MYDRPYFKEQDKQEILRFVHDHPFVFLTGSNSAGRQVATQLPVLVEERDGILYLSGHIMRNSDHHKVFLENPQALAVFTSPSTYVSASWYSDPRMGSTWNYMSVHARGNIRFLSDEDLVAFMKKLTLKFESGDTSSPTFYDNLPDEYLNRMLPMIAGFEIKVDELENIFKLSQNRDEKSYRNIISKLEEQGGNAGYIAEEMKKRIEQLFPEEIKGTAAK